MLKIKRFFALTGAVIMLTELLLMLTSFGAYPFIAAAVILFTAVCAVFFRKYLLYAFTVLLAAGTAVLSFAGHYLGEYIPAAKFDGVTAEITGTAADYVSGGSVVLKKCTVGGNKTDYGIRVYVPDYFTVSPGDTVTLSKTKLSAVKNDGGIYYFHTLSSKTYLTCSGYFTETEITPCFSHGITDGIKRLRHRANEKITAGLSEKSAGTAAALITGDKSLFSEELNEQLRTAGISHIFAVSGMHLALWTSVIFFLFRKGSRVKTIPVAVCFLFILFYTVFTGFSPSVIRSAIMLCTALAATLSERKADALNSLGLAVTAMLTVNPFCAGNISFLLSASATAAIVKMFPSFFTGRNKKRRGRIFSKADSTVSGIVLSFCVIFACLPVTALFFGYVSLLSPVSSLICTPAAEGIMLFTGAGLLLPGAAGDFAFGISEFLCRLMLEFISRVSESTFAVCPADKNTVIPWFTVTVLCVAVISLIKKQKKEKVLTVMLASSLFITIFSLIGEIKQKNEVTLYFPRAGSETCFAAADKSAGQAVLIGAGGDYASYSDMRSFITENCLLGARALIIPRDYRSENGNIKYMSKLADEGMTFSAPLKMSFFTNGTMTVSPDGIPAGRLTINGLTADILFSPSDDNKNTEQSGDILIVRAYIPSYINTENYRLIIVISEKNGETLSLPPNAKSTADGEIEITVSTSGGLKRIRQDL